MRLKLTLCLLSAASALRMGSAPQDTWIASLGKTPTVADVKHMIESAPQDISAQVAACTALRTLSSDRAAEAQSPFAGKYIPTKFLEEGIGEVYAQAILNMLASKEATEDEIGDAANSCVQGGLHTTLQVQNNRQKGLVMFRNSPHLWDAVIGFYQRFWKTYVPKGSCMLAGLYGTFAGSEAPANDFARAGGVELILDWFDHGRTDLDLLQNALCALSDNMAGPDVAAAIFSLDGAKRFTEAVRTIHAAPNQDAIGNGFSLHYQVLEDIVGTLRNDDFKTRRYAKAFIDAGLIDAVIEYMPDDQADFYFQDHCCQTLGWLANDNVTVQRQMTESATLRTLVKDVTDLHCKPNCRWPGGFDFNIAFGAGDKVQPPPACNFLLSNLENSDNMPWKEWSEARFHA